jgi:hypothetical protein
MAFRRTSRGASGSAPADYIGRSGWYNLGLSTRRESTAVSADRDGEADRCVRSA